MPPSTSAMSPNSTAIINGIDTSRTDKKALAVGKYVVETDDGTNTKSFFSLGSALKFKKKDSGKRPKTSEGDEVITARTDESTAVSGPSHGPSAPSNLTVPGDGASRKAISVPNSPNKKAFSEQPATERSKNSNTSTPPTLSPSSSPRSSSSSLGSGHSDQPDPTTSSERHRRPSAPASSTINDRPKHPDDVVYPTSYPWRPSRHRPDIQWINPSHRNPTAKQAFYDTHFGSSSNYRGILPTSFLPTSSGGGTKEQNNDRRKSMSVLDNRSQDRESVSPDTQVDESTESNGKGPFKFVTSKLGFGNKEKPPAPVSENESDTTVPNPPRRPDPTPLLRGGDDLVARRSGFSYGMSLEDAATVEAVVSRQATVIEQDNATSSLTRPPTSSKLKDVLQSAWGFLPSFDLLSSSSSSTTDDRRTAVGTNLEAELIPSVQKDSGHPNYFKQLSGNVVLMGGYRGSVLRDSETGQMMWIPLKVGVGLRRPTLEIDLSSSAEEHSEDLVYSSEMLTHIGMLVDMGKRLKDRIAGRKRAAVYDWGYDWRLSLAISSKRLNQFLEQLHQDSAEREEDRRGAKVVAHSMGGLVALHALATCTNPKVFEGLVFASTPFMGTPNILGPFRFGDAALFNDTICSPRATFSFRSTFYLLPTDGRCFEVPLDDDEEEDGDPDAERDNQRFKDVDFLDPQTWDELGLTPCLEVGKRKKAISSIGQQQGAGEARIDADKSQTDFGVEKSSTAQAKSGTDPDTAKTGDGEQGGEANGMTMGVVEGLGVPSSMSPTVGEDGNQDASSPNLAFSAQPAEQETLQEGNRQGAKRNRGLSDPRSFSSDQAVSSDSTASSSPPISNDYAVQSWLYLDPTLSEVRQFWDEIEKGFDPAKHSSNSYPPIAILTSGRTPCVRGAIVGANPPSTYPSDLPEEERWKYDVRSGDYSLMSYGPGDGVITRKSATTLPGKWSTLLATRQETEKLPQQFWTTAQGKKSRRRLDQYRMRFDGEGIVESTHRHVTLLSDVDGIGKCLEAVRRANLVRGRVPLRT